jgi:hypothetical protein
MKLFHANIYYFTYPAVHTSLTAISIDWILMIKISSSSPLFAFSALPLQLGQGTEIFYRNRV